MIAAIARLGSERVPDRRFRYCNSNYVVAAEIAERASGQDYETLLEAQIAGPLGLPGFSSARSVPGTRLATPHLSLLRRPVDLLAVTRGRVPTDALGPVWGDGRDREQRARPRTLHRGAVRRGARERVDARRDDQAHQPLRAPGRLTASACMTSQDRGAVVTGHDGVYFGWTASTGVDDATATTVSAVANLTGPSVPAARLAKAVRAAL